MTAQSNIDHANKRMDALKLALPMLNAADAKFASSLIAQREVQHSSLSEKQWYWVDKLAARAAQPAPATTKVATTFAKVAILFATAAQHLKSPAIRLALPNGKELRLTMAKATSNNPGYVYIKVDGEYRGKVSPAGELAPFKLDGEDAEQVKAMLMLLAANPAEVAAAYGKLTGKCCFCSIKLTDERSVAVGYGPICAEHYALPWGEKE